MAELSDKLAGMLRAVSGHASPNRANVERAFAAVLVGKKASSAYADKNSVSHWFRWFGHDVPSSDDIRSYIEHARHSLGHSNKTIRAALIRLRRGFKSFGLNDHFTDAIKSVRTSATPERVEIKLIAFSDVWRLVEAPNRLTKTGRRDRGLFALLFGGALRISEALALKLSDVRQTPQGTMFVRLGTTKAGTPAIQAIADEFRPIVLELFAFRMIETGGDDAYLITYYGKNDEPTNTRMERRNASRRIFERWCRKLGIDASPHSARATAITKLLSDGKTYREVQEFSRHANIAMVEVYDKRTFGIDDSPGKKLSFGR